MNNQRIKKAIAALRRAGFREWQIAGFRKWTRTIQDKRRVARVARRAFGIKGF